MHVCICMYVYLHAQIGWYLSVNGASSQLMGAPWFIY